MKYKDQYDDTLNEVHGTVKIAGIEFDTAHALEELDTISYEVGYSAWLIENGLKDPAYYSGDH